MPLDSVTIEIIGQHDTGRTTLASLIRMFLEENGYRHITIEDTEPLSNSQKDKFMNRFLRNKERPITIRVKTVGVAATVKMAPRRPCPRRCIGWLNDKGVCDTCGLG